MIRRDVELSEDERCWLLISQVEHARLSGLLARNLREILPHEACEAITHHDDGWTAWEAAPKINPHLGGPFSFYELPLEESLAIWDGSIDAARRLGPLAGFLVAGHFYNLLSQSEHGDEPAAIAWLAAKRKLRTAWLDEWIRAGSGHTLDQAKRAQQLLLTTDLLSLWLCGDAPIGMGDNGVLEQPTLKARAYGVLDEFQFNSIGFGRKHSTFENPNETLAWVVSMAPFPFHESPLTLSLMAHLVPVAEYNDWPQLQAASRPIELRWRLMASSACPPVGV